MPIGFLSYEHTSSFGHPGTVHIGFERETILQYRKFNISFYCNGTYYYADTFNGPKEDGNYIAGSSMELTQIANEISEKYIIFRVQLSSMISETPFIISCQ